jgi:hypothetical protein
LDNPCEKVGPGQIMLKTERCRRVQYKDTGDWEMPLSLKQKEKIRKVEYFDKDTIVNEFALYPINTNSCNIQIHLLPAQINQLTQYHAVHKKISMHAVIWSHWLIAAENCSIISNSWTSKNKTKYFTPRVASLNYSKIIIIVHKIIISCRSERNAFLYGVACSAG